MIRQTKTAIKELTAQYRAVLKHAFFAGVIAIATAGAASADTWGTQGHLDLNDAKQSIENIDNSWGVIAGLKDAVKNSGGDINGVVNYLATPIDGNGDPIYGENSNVGVISSIIEDTARIQEGFYTTLSGLSDSMSGLAESIKGEGLRQHYQEEYAFLKDYTVSNYATSSSYTEKALNKDTVLDKGDYKFSINGGTDNADLNTADISASADFNANSTYRKSGNTTVKVTSTETPDSSTQKPSDYIHASDYSVTPASGVTYSLKESPDKKYGVVLVADGTEVSGGYSSEQKAQFEILAKAYNDDLKGIAETINSVNAQYGKNVLAQKNAQDAMTADTDAIGSLDEWYKADEAYNNSLASAVDSRILADLTPIYEAKEKWISQELGYDTKTTDAKTELAEAGFNAEDFLGAVKENKGAIATETAARSEADINILKLAMAESNARQTEEQRIETESKDRDDALKTRMDEGQKQVAALFTAEINERKAEDETLQANIDAEASTRANADTTLQANIDAEAAARSEADTTLQANIDAEADARIAEDKTLNDKIEQEVATARAAEDLIRSKFEAADAATLQTANAYTDKKVDTLEKNVSGGVAAATALSAVEVSNVKKGEMSVGGGYGYYNGQSAVAVGAALGLCDSWSVNAGAGIAQGDKTQFSVRAGANYKFKLF
nr:YadA-like family protein [Candidatus Enterousia merdequi]